MKHGQRGAALIETAIALPVILFALLGVTYGIRAGTVSERAESAIRYAGVISAEQSPYHDYSLYSLYNNLGATSNVETMSCVPPNNLLLNGGTLPVVIPGTQQTQRIMPSFWQPDTAPVPFCDSTAVRQLFTGPTRSYLLLQSVPVVRTVVSDGGFFGQESFGSVMQTQYKFYRSADMATLMHCANALSSAVSASLAPLKYGSSNRVTPLQPGDFNSQPISVSANCTAGIGAQSIVPTPPPQQWSGGATPPASTPGPGQSSTPAPTPTPTATPPTPKPSTTPSPSPTPVKTASPTPSPVQTGGSGGGGGAGGGGSPTPTATPKGGTGGSPAPPCCGPPTGTPTAKPTPSPVPSPATPKPSASPATPKPSPTPTAVPTVKPAPSPSPSVPPGSIS